MEYQTEKRMCQNCKGDFTIDPEDFVFYDKIKVPPPTFCPECRNIRRLSWRNNRSLHSRSCGVCKKNLISFYKDDGAPVYCESCYSGDNWDMYKFSADVDFSKDFFTQLKNILNVQPRVFSIRYGTNLDSDYSNSIVNSKNLYLSFSSIESENIFYSENVDRSKDCFDCLSCIDIQQCSWNINSEKNYNCHYMFESKNCMDSSFLFDCSNCSNCFMSSGLRNESYVFRNVKLSKSDYEKAIQDLERGSFKTLVILKDEFKGLISSATHRFANVIASVDVSGDIITRSKNVKKSFDIMEAEDISYSYRIVKSKDLMDCGWVLAGELEYETMTGSGGSFNQVSCFMCVSSRDIQYSISCKNCTDCIGCVGLTNARYCILNKQYSKDAYFDAVGKIKKHMIYIPYVDKQGRVYKYGEFFPTGFSLFGYNESLANDMYPISKDTALDMGYNWYERDIRDYKTNQDKDTLPDCISEINDSILDDVILCSKVEGFSNQCTYAFRIKKEELEFCKKNNLPIPRLCPNCRHEERLRYRNPLSLYNRECSNNCGTTFQTTYAPDRPERVYCEKCYQQEVL
ncbi:MAG: hypothetical protein WC089_02655 [Candidatus Paceibacterota bacterium]